MKSLRLDLHVHSESFGRVFMDEHSLRDVFKRKGLDGAAITNFSNIHHAKWLKEKLKEFTIIVGQEIWTKDGHIIGLGLNKRIDNFISAEEAIEHIHTQGGIAVAPHPFLYMGIGKKVYDLPVDVIEAYNGILGGGVIFNLMAQRAAKRLNCAVSASSDTTDVNYVGHTHTEVLLNGSPDVLKAILDRKVNLVKRPLPLPLLFVAQNFLKFKNVKPCVLHASVCFICGYSCTTRLWKEEFVCLDCAKREKSHIACCNGHFICVHCVMKRIEQKDHFSTYEPDAKLAEAVK